MTDINLNQTFIQLSQRSIAKFGAGVHGNNFYSLIEFIYLMINVAGEEKVVEMLKSDTSPNSKKLKEIGEKWKTNRGFKKELEKFNKVIQITKPAFDLLDDKTMKDNKKPTYAKFITSAKNIPLIQDQVFALFVFFVNSSNLKNLGIPSELWKVLEMKSSRIGEFGNRRPNPMGSPMGEMGGMR